MKQAIVISFAALCLALSGYAIYKGILVTSNALDLRTVLLGMVDDNMKVLASEEVLLKQDAVGLERARLQAKKDNIRFWMLFENTASITLTASVTASIWLSALAYRKRAGVHLATIKGSSIPIREKDLTNALPIMQGLVVAAQLEAKAETAQQALNLYALLSDTVTKQIRGLVGHKGMAAALPASIAAEPVQPSLAPEIPDFTDMLNGLQAGGQMVLGFDYTTGAPVHGSFKDLYSSFIAGKSGSGKSSWLRALILQSLKVYPGINFYVLDPHSEHPESLSKELPRIEAFHYLDAADPRKGMYAFNKLLQHRLDHPSDQDAPAVFVVDELSFCSRQKYAQTLKTLLERISNEGRKTRCYALLSSQDTRLKRSGDFRDMLSSSYVFALKPNQARYLLQDRDEMDKVKMLFETKARGVALFAPSEHESRLVRLPFCSASDARAARAECLPPVNTDKHPLSKQSRQVLRQESRQLRQDEQAGVNSLEKQPEQVSKQVFKQAEELSEREQIKALMESKGITLNSLAKQADVPKSSLSNYLNEKGELSPEKLQKIHDIIATSEQVNSLEKQAEQDDNDTMNTDAPVLMIQGAPGVIQ